MGCQGHLMTYLLTGIPCAIIAGLSCAVAAAGNTPAPGKPLNLAKALSLFTENPPGPLANTGKSAASRFSFRMRGYENGTALHIANPATPYRLRMVDAFAYRDRHSLVLTERLYGGYLCYSGLDGSKGLLIGFDPATPRRLFFYRRHGAKLILNGVPSDAVNYQYGVVVTGPVLLANLSFFFNRGILRNIQSCQFDGRSGALAMFYGDQKKPQFLDVLLKARPWISAGYPLRALSYASYGPDGGMGLGLLLSHIRVGRSARQVPVRTSLVGLKELGFRLIKNPVIFPSLPRAWSSHRVLAESNTARVWAGKFERWAGVPSAGETSPATMAKRRGRLSVPADATLARQAVAEVTSTVSAHAAAGGSVNTEAGEGHRKPDAAGAAPAHAKPLSVTKALSLFTGAPPGPLAYEGESAASRFSFRIHMYQNAQYLHITGPKIRGPVPMVSAFAYRGDRSLVLAERLYGGYVGYSGCDGRKSIMIGFDPNTPRYLFVFRQGGLRLEVYGQPLQNLHFKYGIAAHPRLSANFSFFFNRRFLNSMAKRSFATKIRTLALFGQRKTGSASMNIVYAPRPWSNNVYPLHRFSATTRAADGGLQYEIRVADIHAGRTVPSVPVHTSAAGLREIGFTIIDTPIFFPSLAKAWNSHHALAESATAKRWAKRFTRWMAIPGYNRATRPIQRSENGDGAVKDKKAMDTGQ